MRNRRTYTDEEKAAGLAALVAHGGDVSKAARASGISARCIARWRDETPAAVAEIADGKREDLAAMMDRIARRAVGYIDLAFDAMDAAKTRNGDSMTGVMALERLSELNRIAGTAVDKTQLLSGGATARIEHDVVIDAGDDGRD